MDLWGPKAFSSTEQPPGFREKLDGGQSTKSQPRGHQRLWTSQNCPMRETGRSCSRCAPLQASEHSALQQHAYICPAWLLAPLPMAGVPRELGTASGVKQSQSRSHLTRFSPRSPGNARQPVFQGAAAPCSGTVECLPHNLKGGWGWGGGRCRCILPLG